MIKINHLEKPPHHSLLKKYIKSFWMLEGDLPEGLILSSRDIPNGEIQIVINLYGSIKGQNHLGKDESLQKPIIRAQQSKFNLLHKSGSFKLLGITFYPYGLANFTSIPISEFSNQIIDLYDIFPFHIEERLYDLEFLQQQTVLENFFLSQLIQKQNPTPPIVEFLTQQIILTKGAMPISKLLPTITISQKHAERLFKQWCGLSPKQIAQQIRMDQLIKELYLEENKDLIHMATKYGFHDQSHLTHDFKKLTGLTPGKFEKHIITLNHSYNLSSNSND
jgi:AraC-like DNA-binding protein